VQRVGVRQWPADVRGGEAEPQAKAGGRHMGHYEIGSCDLRLERFARAGFGEKSPAIRHAAIGEDCVDPGDRGGVAVPVGRWDFGGAPGAGAVLATSSGMLRRVTSSISLSSILGEVCGSAKGIMSATRESSDAGKPM
jgi:hypothetical protein